MNEKGSGEIADYSEKAQVQEDLKHEIAGDLGRRRKSVALNIVENPLQVSFLRFAWEHCLFLTPT